MIKFYETPLGQKTIRRAAAAHGGDAQKGRGAGCAEWAKTPWTEVLAEHPDLAEALENAGKSKQP